MVSRNDSIMEAILSTKEGRERLLVRFFAVMLSCDQELRRQVLGILFKKDLQGNNRFHEISKECEVWFDLPIIRKQPWCQPAIIIVNPGFWENHIKRYCYLIDIRRKERLTGGQIDRYCQVLNKMQRDNENFNGALAILTDFPPPARIEAQYGRLIRLFWDKELMDTFKRQLNYWRSKHNYGKLNSSTAYMISQFLLWCSKERERLIGKRE